MNDVSRAAGNTVLAQMRYVNTEWKHTDEIPRIGSRETRRANTSFHDIQVHNARPGLASGAITLERNGFTLTRNPTACPDFRDEETVRTVYYPEVERVVRETTGADRVFIRSHLIRTETPIDFNDGYARFVHCDYNIKRLVEMSEDVLKQYGVEPDPNWDYVWFNTWQPFDNPAVQNPMAFLDWASLPMDDVIDYYYTGRNYDALVAAPVFNPDHKWQYVPNMQTDEILVFKQMDGRGGDRSIYCPHTSFDNKSAPADAPPRRSCETRILACYERK